MSHRRSQSIRARLFAISLFATGVAVLLAGGALCLYELQDQRAGFEQSLRVRSAVLGATLVAAVEFEDSSVALDILRPLESDPYVVFAAAYTADGRRLATFPEGATAPDVAPELGTREEGSVITDVSAIDDQVSRLPIGRLLLVSDLGPMYDALERRLLTMAGILFLSLVIATYLGTRLQERITQPIHELVRAAGAIQESQDFSARATRMGGGELGVLTDAFNDMLDRIEKSNLELRAHRDVLEHKVRERTYELELALDRAESANRAKTDFLANMSHEIRTPMTAIMGYAELLLDRDQSEEERRNASETIDRNSKHLLTIINDILDISKIEAGQMSIERIAASPGAIVEEVVNLLQQRADEKGLDLAVEERGAAPDRILTDPTRLRQILLNLTGNAIKFTERGSVRLVTDFRLAPDDPQGEGTLVVQIIDTGIGLTPDELGRLFRPFHQADETVTREFGGTGLGLVISRRLAELLGGGVEVESEKGRGSTFTVFVSTGRLDDAASLTATPQKVVHRPRGCLEEGTKLLLVEDGPDNQRLIQFVLQKAGAQVDVAANGQLGLDAALAAWEEGAPYEVILMDMQMPVLDGYSATRQLREAGYPYPIVALTAHAFEGDDERCREAGCDDYATKPIDRTDLTAKIAFWKGHHAVTEAKWRLEPQ